MEKVVRKTRRLRKKKKNSFDENRADNLLLSRFAKESVVWAFAGSTSDTFSRAGIFFLSFFF